MNLEGGWTDLNAALKDLRESWHEVKLHWRDPVQQQFEESFWQPLEAQVRAALRGIERFTPVLAKMRQDCGEK